MVGGLSTPPDADSIPQVHKYVKSSLNVARLIVFSGQKTAK